MRGRVHGLPGFVAVAALIAFAVLAAEIAIGTTIVTYDRAFAEALDRSVTPGWLEVFKTITLLGTGWALGVASGIVGVWLLVRRQFVLAIGWTAAQVGAVVLVKGVKALIERERPGLGDTTFFAHGWSFPSGHVVRTFVSCAMATYLVFRLSRSWVATAIVGIVGLVWSLLMAFSRLYLGAHFASDAVGGLIVATAWAALCISAVEVAMRQRSEE